MEIGANAINMIDIPDGVEEIIGMELKHQGGGSFSDRHRAVLDVMEDGVRDKYGCDPWPLTITMPCGTVTTFETRSDVPMETVMCPCGDPNHVVLKISYGE